MGGGENDVHKEPFTRGWSKYFERTYENEETGLTESVACSVMSCVPCACRHGIKSFFLFFFFFFFLWLNRNLLLQLSAVF